MSDFKQELKELMEKYEVSITAQPVHDYQGSYVTSIDFEYKENGFYKELVIKGDEVVAKDIK